MVSQLVKVVHCDVCGGEDAAEFRAVRAASGPRDIDLCRAHAEPVLALEALLEAHGRPDHGRPPEPGKRTSKARGIRAAGVNPNGYQGADRRLGEPYRTCPKCGQVAVTRQALSAHARHEHASALVGLESGLGAEYQCAGCTFRGRYAAVSGHARNAGHSLLS